MYIFSLGIVLSVCSFIPSNWLAFALPKIFVLNLFLLLSYIFAFNQQIDFDEVKKRLLSPANKLIFLFFLFLIIYTVFAKAPFASLFGISSTYTGLIAYINLFLLYLYILFFVDKNTEDKILNSIVISNAVIVFYGVLEILKLDFFGNIWLTEKFIGRIFSLIGHPNWLGAFVVLTLPIVIYRVISDKWLVTSLFKKISYSLLILFNLVVLIATVSKAAILGLGVILIIFVVKYLIENKKIKVSFLKILVSLVLIIPLIGFSIYTVKSRYSNSFESGRSTSSREIMWTSSVKMLIENPLGLGIDAFQLIYPQFNDPKLWEYDNITARIDKPHNQIIELYSAIGPIGVLVFYSFIILLLYKNLRKSFSSIEFLLSLSLIGYLISNLFGFDVIPNLIVFFVLLGLLVCHSELSRNLTFSSLRFFTPFRMTNWGKFMQPIMIFICLILLITFNFHLKHLIANNYYYKADIALASEDYNEALNNFQQAINIYPYDRVYLLQAIEFLLAVYDPKDPNLQNFGPLINDYINKAKILTDNLDPELPVLEAWYFAKIGDIQNFQNKLNEAYRKNPYSVLTYKISARIYEELGDIENQKKELEKLKNLLPEYWDNPEIDAGRIFQKNNPWVVELLLNL